jgi:fructose-1,6-bisphosphatase/inositol monophosphatase family enzyme
MDTFMKVAVDAARQAGGLLEDNWQKAKTIEIKTDIVDLVTNVDKASDALITGILRSRFPDHQIIAEESAVSGKPALIAGTLTRSTAPPTLRTRFLISPCRSD